MRTLTLRTKATRPQEPRLLAKPCLVDRLPERPVQIFMQHSQKRLPRAFLSSRSVHGRYYYTKMRTARGKGARDAISAAIGMRWNYYLAHGKHTPHFVPQERHTVAIASGLMNELRHSRNRETAGEYRETHAHTHARGYDAPGVMTQCTGHSTEVILAIQRVQTAHPSAQSGVGRGEPQHVTFSFSISASGNDWAGESAATRMLGGRGHVRQQQLSIRQRRIMRQLRIIRRIRLPACTRFTSPRSASHCRSSRTLIATRRLARSRGWTPP